MPFNLLIFPLVGGYYLCIRFLYLKYIHQRLDRQKLLFNSIIWGVILLVVTFGIRTLVDSIFPTLLNWIYPIFPVKTPYFGTTSFSFLLSIMFTEVGNIVCNREKAIKYAIGVAGSELEILMKSAIEQNDLMQFSLQNDKSYIGWVKEFPLPSQSSYIRIIPVISGYRDDKKNLVFTIEYLDVYSEFLEEGSIENPEDLETDIVIKMSEIISANKFNLDVYEKFNNKAKDE